ncbi:hypothetical protein SOVF_046150 [Spinacia oleracea]|nr:hypothetical protein SOVF_046150 [Spinacia oleracea]
MEVRRWRYIDLAADFSTFSNSSAISLPSQFELAVVEGRRP